MEIFSLALPEWNEKFLIVAVVSDELPASAAAIEVQETFFQENKALTFKTPVKQKRLQDNEGQELPDPLDLSPYSPFFKKDEEAPITEVVHVVGVLARLDQGIATNSNAMLTLVEDYRSEHA
jgi:hypothetical protein